MLGDGEFYRASLTCSSGSVARLAGQVLTSVTAWHS